jgi:hypothetical protein
MAHPASFFAPTYALLAPLVLGAALLRAVGVRFASERVAYLGWAWMAGCLGVAALQLGLLLAGAGDVHPLAADALVLVLAGGLALAGRRVAPVVPATPGARHAWPRWERIAFALALAVAVLVLANRIFLRTLEPIYLDDEAIFWSHRAKALFRAGGFGGTYPAELREVAHSDYPLLNPLLQVWMFVHAGGITHVVNRLPMQMCALAAALCVAGGALRHSRPGIAGALVLAFAASELVASSSRRAHSDILVALGAVVMLDAWLRWRAQPHAAWWKLGALGAACALWSKNDGAMVVFAAACAFVLVHLARPRELLARLRPRRVHLWLLVPLAVVVSTLIHNRAFGVGSDLILEKRRRASLPARLLEKWDVNGPEVLRYFADAALDPLEFWMLPAALVVLVLLRPRASLRDGRGVPLLALLLATLGYVAIFTATTADLDWHLRTAARRILLQIFPAIVVLLAAQMGSFMSAPQSTPERRPTP